MKATGAWEIAVALCAASALLLSTRESVAQLQVDRTSGSIQFVVPSGDPVAVNGYSISSGNGLLNPETWNSLSDQGLEGWNEANPRTEMLTELNPYGSTDAAGATWNLGNAYTGTTVSPREEDVTVQYSLTDGTVVDGAVEYLGPINDFVLRIDPTSGAGQLELLSSVVGPYDVTGYSIFSASGALAVGNFTGLGEAGWTNANPQATALAELNLEGSKMFTTNTTASIGNIFTVGGTQDLTLQFSTVAGDLLPGTVTYGATSVTPGDCNGDGVVDINDANCTVDADLDAFLAGLNPASLRGDLDGDGVVQFSDFVVLSNNFANAGMYTDGDFDKDGTVQFGDFVILSNNFGQSGGAAAAAVPEPATGLLALLGLVGLAATRRLRLRPRIGHCLAACLVLGLVASASSVYAVDFDSRLIRIDPAGANATIDSATEARGILRGTVTDVTIAEDVTGTVERIDFAGGAGSFSYDEPYPNGVNDITMVDFLVHVTGALEIPEGEWTIGFNSDDGGYLSLPRVNFSTKGGENGATGVPGELMFNATRGFAWTYGQFTVPAGETLRTEFEALMFERGGGDGLEVAIVDGFEDGTGLVSFGFELADGEFGWTVLESGPAPGDFNWDDAVDFADFTTLSNNFGTGTSFAQGDMNGDGKVDLVDFTQLVPLLPAPAGAAAVPEPGSFALMGFASAGLLLAARRRRSRPYRPGTLVGRSSKLTA